jgi:predicted DNA-binding protein
MPSKTAVKIPSELYQRAQAAAEKAGYSSVEEFVEHSIEKALLAMEAVDPESETFKRLRGLGYIE